jgi:hypothetical protein
LRCTPTTTQRARARHATRAAQALDRFPTGQALPDFSPDMCEPARHLSASVGSQPWLRKLTRTGWTWSGVKQVRARRGPPRGARLLPFRGPAPPHARTREKNARLARSRASRPPPLGAWRPV